MPALSTVWGAMQLILDYVVHRTWWTYDPAAHWYAQSYHWLNLVEGAAWLVFAGLVLWRYRKHRRSHLELFYAAAFFTFGLSDFREAYALQSWLLLFKGANLAALLYLRHAVLTRYYPGGKTY